MKPLGLLAFALLSATLPSFAQQVISAKSGLLSYVEGAVTLNGEPVIFPASISPTSRKMGWSAPRMGALKSF